MNVVKKSKKVVYIEDSFKEQGYEDKTKEEVIDLREALKELPAKYKTVVILKYFEDMTLEEISKTLDLPLSTVKSQLYRGLKKLRIDLEEVDSDEK